MPRAKKTYCVKHYYSAGNRNYFYSGTVEELIQIFNYTLICGHSWDHKVALQPKTIKAFVTAVNRAFNARNCFDHVELC